MDSSSSDGEYSYVDPGSPMLGFSNNARARQGTPALSALSAGVCAGPRRTSPLGVVGTIFVVAACAVLIVVGLVAAGAVDRDVIPAGITDYFQRVPSATPSAAAGSDANLRAGEVSGYIPRHRTSVFTRLQQRQTTCLAWMWGITDAHDTAAGAGAIILMMTRAKEVGMIIGCAVRVPEKFTMIT